MLLIALVGVGGFTVLAQRRLRAIGMLAAQGATQRHLRLVVRANGAATGIVGAVAGAVLGFLAWLAYRPQAENGAHHVMGVFQLPWAVIGIAMALAIIATYFAASRPAKTIAKVPVVAALAGRPPAPKKTRHLAIPVGLVFLVGAFLLLGAAGATAGGGGGQNQGMLELVVGFVALAVAIVLSLSALIAVIICVVSAARFGDVLDYAGPNLSSNQLIVYAPGNTNGRSAAPDDNPTAAQIAAAPTVAKDIAAGLGTTSLVPLETSNANLNHAANGRSWSGQIYVATPQLLGAFGIKQSEINPDADILTMRPGLSTMSLMQLTYGNQQGGGQLNNGPGNGPSSNNQWPRSASSGATRSTACRR